MVIAMSNLPCFIASKNVEIPAAGDCPLWVRCEVHAGRERIIELR